jgi:dTDP-4-amino-4,6-dideoxygalactose transaminase
LEPYFVDIRAGDLCTDERLVAEALAELGDQVAVVVPYAAFGTVCDLEYYRALHEAGVPVVVDAAASFGACSGQVQFGTGFPGAVVFSFHATKSFGIGEGGLVYSGDAALIERVRRASNFGFSAARASESRGLNGKLSEYAAAVALATLDRFEAKMRLRQTVYDAYVNSMLRRGLLDRGWQLQQTAGRVPHQFMSVLCPERLDNVQVVAQLEQRGIQTRTYFSPACHEQPALAGYRAGPLPVTTAVACRILNLPLWEDIPLETVERVVLAVAAL